MIVMKPKFSQKQTENIRERTDGIAFELNEGTIRSGKTMSDCFKMAAFYLSSPDKNHLVLAYNQEQAFRMFMDADGFGLMHIFKNNSELRHDDFGDHLWLKLPNGTEKHIYYKGGGNISAVGAITGMSYGSITFLEFNFIHPNVIEEAFKRTLAAKRRFFLAEQNPPAPNHPNLEKIERFKEAGTFKFRHWIPTDNPTLTGKRLEEWKQESSASPYLYKRDWLGQRVMPEGIVYQLFDEDEFTITKLKGEVVEMFFSGDAGQNDATTMSCNIVTRVNENGKWKFILNRVANYYHSGSENKVVVAMSTYAQHLKQFILWCRDKYRLYENAIIVDPAALSLRAELEKLGLDVEAANNNSHDRIGVAQGIEAGVDRMKNLMANKQFYLLKQTENKYDHYHFVKEIGMYVRDDTTHKPVDKNNHAMDEMRYSGNYFYSNYIA